MSVRINKTATQQKVMSHNELLDIGLYSHEEIDSHIEEVKQARGSYLNLNDRITAIETTANQNEQHIIDHENRVQELENKATNYGIRIGDLETQVDEFDSRIDSVEGEVVSIDGRVLALEQEVASARGVEATLPARLDKMAQEIEAVKKDPVTDLLVTDAVYLPESNEIRLTVFGGRASINTVIVDVYTKYYHIPNVETNTDYYIHLKQDGSITHTTTSEEMADSIILAVVRVGATVDAISVSDLRYFVTKGSEFKAVDNLQQRVSDLEERVSSNEQIISTIDTLQHDMSSVEQELLNARIDKNGVIYDALKDRLDNMQARLELAESRGTVEKQYVWHKTWPPFSRSGPQRDFRVPKYVVGSNSVEVFVDGFRVDVDDDYIEYSDTLIRFNYDIPPQARVTIISRGSVINTNSTTEYEYYPDGRLKRKKIVGGIDRTIEYIYDENKQLIREEITESNGEKKSKEYIRDENGLVIREINNGADYYVLQAGATYDDTEVKRRLDFLEQMGMDLDVEYRYDEKGRIIEESVYVPATTPQLLKKTTFSYNADDTVNTETVIYDGRKVTKMYHYQNGFLTKVEIRKEDL